ncbi:MAG: flagellar biosynthesis protein FliC [Ignavibacteriales bacterium]|nr:MAG: flagellin-related protein FliC [Stygiobacter sp.]KAF0211001.1 MAG: flagellin-related protein [Ignavibacteria bacterium]MBI3124948.1 flagellar biosynthesis protein FliC [Ignavibacteriales bacterium]OGU63518.1 MAG: flagellar biosynthesis protein FliC [Stygiobacter sp. GWC2_38_9]OGU86041.1 MAG: flagellar biosynthesis protein FliC [Stygiobacter sp. RIFOXYA12_FULL_38_9]OGV07377.1 MAG: flagellar biosynthesis protein FliC [Stygiobacter sp. RIFOXYB2_FULL_37_11]OGV14680.1 MAG: flagellar biosyn
MAFSVNTNLGALQAYNALAKVNAQTEKAQLRLATTKKINSVADDTSGYNVGKKLEAQTLTQKAQLNNIASAKNFLATAESALQQINDKLNQIKAKQVDSDDALKDTASIAKDIRTLAAEIDSILKNTNINGTQLLASTDGSTALSASTFDVGGATFSVDFASGYLSSSTLATAIGSASGMQSSTDATVLDYDTTTVVGNVRSALGRIGNLVQTLDSRQEYLTAAIANNTASIANLFDADMAAEQLNATKGQISGQVATAMLSQMNSAPQNILSLFK